MSTIDTPKTTGVPPHVLLISKIEVIILGFRAFRVDIKGNIGGKLDIRGLGVSEFNTNQILDAITNCTASTTNVSEISCTSDGESSNIEVTVITDEEIVIFSTYVDQLHDGLHLKLQGIVERKYRSKTK